MLDDATVKLLNERARMRNPATVFYVLAGALALVGNWLLINESNPTDALPTVLLVVSPISVIAGLFVRRRHIAERTTVLSYDLKGIEAQNYNAARQAFSLLGQSQRIWRITIRDGLECPGLQREDRVR